MTVGSDKREFAREESKFGARLNHEDTDHHCEVEDISPGGAKVRSPAVIEIGVAVILRLDPFGHVDARVVWSRRGRLGLKFDADPEEIAELVMAIAMHGAG